MPNKITWFLPQILTYSSIRSPFKREPIGKERKKKKKLVSFVLFDDSIQQGYPKSKVIGII